jgi:thiamine-monophosphate kinase
VRYPLSVLVSEVGEFGLIELLCRELGLPYPPGPGRPPRRGFIVDVGDDALLTAPSPDAGVWTTDTLVAGVHFVPDVTPWRNVGWKALAVNVSDVAAMGGTPSAALVTLCLPGDFCVEDAVELYGGLRECCDAYGVRVAGGDVVRSPVFTVTVALSGAVPAGGPYLTRSAAKPGDAIAVSGALGAAAAGARLLLAGRRESAPSELIEAQERPRPPARLGPEAARAGLRCGIDVSDGLVQDLGHVCRASGLAARIEAAKVPVSPALRREFPKDALDLALTGGEDYQLLLCGPLRTLDLLIAAGAGLTIIGETVAGEPSVTVTGPAGDRVFEQGGWDHFRSGP